ncbi:hypothetical protein AXF42_Ash020705 [Apostasia shenzhenica]|uniref:Uncharacterized protein n=1 Tax=Apostasia shenzhenica TaxID=1088818 RepID=A0A2H9ZY86_9ASPA|nr:hypothetical protein AXF42_Ash020705 [Apostasia shenzhenica]
MLYPIVKRGLGCISQKVMALAQQYRKKKVVVGTFKEGSFASEKQVMGGNKG